ncbi:MAG: YlmC/YmxH family sporulation protein [Bacilli bacterium]
MRLSELQNKRIVNSATGGYIGEIIDIIIDNNGQIESIVVEKSKFIISRFTSKDEVVIKWNKIEKIGEDVILTNV